MKGIKIDEMEQGQIHSYPSDVRVGKKRIKRKECDRPTN